MTISCPATKISCGGSVQLKATPKARSSKKKKAKPTPVVLGLGAFSLTGGAKETVTVHLSATGLALLQRERTLRRPVVRAKLWLQSTIAGTPRLPSHRMVDAELDREVHPAPPPSTTPGVLAGGAGVR